MIAGSPALRWLIAAKLRGTIRKQIRRLKQPSGIVLGILGAILFSFWILSLTIGTSLRGDLFTESADPRMVRVICFVMTLLTLTGAISHRGVVMPREEIERLFAGPVSRADIVRYRMLANSGRYVMSGLVFALLAVRNLPHPIFGPASVFVAMMTLPLAGQAAALLLGSAEHRFADKWRSGSRARILQMFSLLLVLAIVMFMVFGRELVPKASLESLAGLKDRALDWPIVRLLLIPFIPWSNAMTATTVEEFAPSFGILLVFWVMLFEFAARLPIDFRELSLDTSANVAKRIREMRRSGMGASSGKASLGRFGKRVPWIFGRSAFGAVAWMKFASVLRKAKGTLLVSLLILTGLTTFAVIVSRGEESLLVGSGIIALIGTVYLCGALRFDFRADIDRLEAFKSWPLRPALLFVANLLPQVLVVSIMISTGLAVQGAIFWSFSSDMQRIILGVPLLVFCWTALDNAVFLLFPQRTIAGQEGILQHLGRSVLLISVRGAALVFVVGPSVLIGFGVDQLAKSMGATLEVRHWSILVALLVILLLVAIVLAHAGGRALRRLDVSRIPK